MIGKVQQSNHERGTAGEVIAARNAVKEYPGGILALDGLSVTLYRGEMVGILGPSGAGKTTFLRLLNGSLTPSAGEIRVLGQSLKGIKTGELRRLRSRMSLVQQNHNIIPSLSVAHNVLMGKLGKISTVGAARMLLYLTREERDEVAEVLGRLEIGDKLFSRCGELSGGQQQRVAVARAILADPEIIMADEPIASVDPRTAEVVMNQFRRLNSLGKTVILNLHQVDFALQYCTRLLVLSRGKLVFDGLPEDYRGREIFEHSFAGEERRVYCAEA